MAAERSLFGDRRDRETVYVASETGLTRVAVAAGQVGEFALPLREPTRAVAADGDRLLVATDASTLLGPVDDLAATGLGPAAAVGFDEGRPLAATPDGRILAGPDDWTPLGTVAEPRALAGDLLAAGDGVYRVGDADLTRVRPGPATAVAPGYAATLEGLVALPDTLLREGPHTAVAATDGTVHAVADGRVVRSAAGADTPDSAPVDLPTDERVVALAGGAAVYALTGAGRLLVRAAPEQTPDGHAGWGARTLGVRGATGLAVGNG